MIFKTRRDALNGLGLTLSTSPAGGSSDPAGGSGTGGSSGSGGTTGGSGSTTGSDPAPDLAKENAELKAQIAALEAKSKGTDDPDLNERARRDREAKDKDSAKVKRLESSIEFNMRSGEFLKSNAPLLPKDVEDIFKAAEKERYADQTEKADAIKTGLIQSFFAVQANVDLLTQGQKAQLDDYLRLTKNGKQDKAQQIYELVFEPAFEMLKRTKRAEALARGHTEGNGLDDAYKQRLMAGSAKHYRLEKR